MADMSASVTWTKPNTEIIVKSVNNNININNKKREEIFLLFLLASFNKTAICI